MAEVWHFAMVVRRAFRGSGQVIMSSHSAETIRSFSDDNTWVLECRSHLDPTVLRPLAELTVEGDLVQAILTGDLAA
jgi:predicted ATPase